MSDNMSTGAALAWITFAAGLMAAWGTHVIWIVTKLASDHGATGGQMVLGALGALMPPVGIIHGVILWLS